MWSKIAAGGVAMSNGLQRGILVALTSRTRRFETLADVLATGYARFPAKGIQINYLAVQLFFTRIAGAGDALVCFAVATP